MTPHNTQLNSSEFEDLVAERLSLLPPEVRRAIADSQLDAHLLEVARKNNLRTDESKVFENETMLALLGVEPLEDLEYNLKTHAHLSPEHASAVAEDVGTLIFAPIRESLKRFWDEESSEDNNAQSERKENPLGFAPSTKITGRGAGIERTMPHDIIEAKLKGTVHTETEKHTTGANTAQNKQYIEEDPYREPID